MKTATTYIVLAFMILTFTHCRRRGSQVPTPEPHVTIVKFENPSYMKHLIVRAYEGNDEMVLMRGNMCEETYYSDFPEKDADGTLIDGSFEFDFPARLHDPFWEVGDGWYLIDWAWFGLESAYPYDGNTILTEVTFDNYLDNKSCFFNKSTTPHITFKDKKEIFETKLIKIADIMAYYYPDGDYPSYSIHQYNKEYGYDVIETFPNQYYYHQCLQTTNRVSYNICNCLCEIADEMDEYWSLIQEQIKTIISNGDLNNLKAFDVNQLNISIE